MQDKDPRPLSPHLQVYRWQLTSVLSILHRATGVALSIGLVLLVYWLVALAAGQESFASAQQRLGSPPGLVVLGGFSFAFFYHICNGIRHLFWDVGKGFELGQTYASGWAVVASAFVLTGFAWVVGTGVIGGAS